MNADDLCFQSATTLAQAYREKSLSPVEVLDAVLARIERLQPKLNCFTLTLPEQARAQAKAAEAALAKGGDLPPLLGIPATVKDMVMMKDLPFMAGSKIYENRVADEDAPIVARMKAAGALIVGKTTTPEFGWKALTDSVVTGMTHNPWNLDHNPGGSSGGAAAACAAGLAPLNTGGDGAGSIRIPASFCGVFGIKPSYGRVPVHPQGGEQLAHLGPITRTVADAALMLHVTAGPHWKDRMSLASTPEDYPAELGKGVKGLRVAWSADLGFAEHVDPQVLELSRKAAQAFTELGAHVEEVKIDWGNPLAINYVLWPASQAAIARPYMKDFAGQMDPGFLACAVEGLGMPAHQFQSAQAERHALYYRVSSFFQEYDLLLTPSVAEPALRNGELYPSHYADHPWDWLRWAPFSFPFNLTHMPAATVPAGYTREGLPVGLQIASRRLNDLGVLQAAAAYEQARPWAAQRPPL